MIVLDASAAIEYLAGHRSGASVEQRLRTSGKAIHVPAVLDLEITQVLRRHVASGRMSVFQATGALNVWRAVPAKRHDHAWLLPRIWALRNALTAYDAAYVALAETLDAPLVTCDGKLARSKGHYARIELIG